MNHSTRFSVAALLLAAVSPAQLTISDGNMNVVTGPISATSNSPVSFSLQGDALAIDHGFEHWWYYRIAGDTREFALHDIGPVQSGVTASLDHLDRDFGDVDGRGLLRASLDMDTYDAGPASGVLISRLTVANISASPVTFSLFCYTDLDIAGSAGNDVVTGTNSSHFVRDGSGVQVEVRAIGNDLSDVGAYPGIRTLLTNSTVEDLAGNLPPLSGDYTGAFEWQNRTLAPFEEHTYTVVMAVDTAAVAVPLVENYGVANGVPFQIHTQTLPLQDNTQARSFSVRMKGAVPFAEYRIASAFLPFNAFPLIPGIDFWVDPGLLIGVFGGFCDAFGEAGETFTIPASPYLTGFPAYHQAFSVAAAAPNGFAYFTPGMLTRIGKL